LDTGATGGTPKGVLFLADVTHTVDVASVAVAGIATADGLAVAFDAGFPRRAAILAVGVRQLADVVHAFFSR
jgi:hypothetical protein